MAENADNTLMLEILKEVRKEQRDQRGLLLLVSERVDRLDRHFEERLLGVERKLLSLEERMGGIKDDLELMIKSELMGRLGNFEVRMMNLIEERLAQKAE